ncbi:stonustoxin subunit beta-like [Diretmus argenteus]
MITAHLLDQKLLLYCVLFCSSDLYEIKLDLNTAHRRLSLSENNRKVTLLREDQPRPYNPLPERFISMFQVLCRDGLTGQCYFEAEWEGEVGIGMTYRGIGRRGEGDDSRIGGNHESWSLDCYGGSKYAVYHNNIRTKKHISSFSSSNRVGVYLDWPAGTLSFYRVSSDSLIHLHTFTSTFTEPLYPGFRLRVRARCIIESTFGRMNGRWRATLFKALEVRPGFVSEIALACAFLHNICLANGDILDEDPEEPQPEEPDPPAPPDQDIGDREISGNHFRDRMCAQISATRQLHRLIEDHDYADI